MKRLYLLLFTFILSHYMNAQELPFKEIPEYPDSYTAGSVAARMVEGLGFRFYWATESLRQEDLDYRVTEKSRTSFQTIEHVHGLSKVILNALKKQPNTRSTEKYDFQDLRRSILMNLKEASEILRNSSDDEMGEFELVFGASGNETRYPFWNNINGPIADALWHTGQIVTLRRASGNPFTSKVSLMTGKIRE